MTLALRYLIAGFAVIGLGFSALAQPANQDELIAAVTQAEAAVVGAETELRVAHAAGDSLLTEYDKALVDRDLASQQIGQVLDTVDRAQDRVDRLPITLTAREAALTDVLIQMYDRGASSDDADVIRREAERADVKRQIARLQVGIDVARRRVDNAFARKDAAFDVRNQLDAKIARMDLDAQNARYRIEVAEDALATARDTLERACNQARWHLNDDPPPILASVKAQRGRRVFYEAKWINPAEEVE